MGDTEDAARVDIADERGGDPVADDDANARAAGTESTPGDDGGVASEDATTSGADLDLHVDATRGGVAEASSAGDSQGDDPRTIQAPAIQIPGRAGHHRGRHRRGKSRGGSGGGSGWGSYGGGSGDGFGRFGWGSATIDEWVMSGWNASQSNTPRGGDVSGSPAWGRAAGGFDPFAGSPRAGSFTSGSNPPTNNGNGNPSHARWSNAASQGGASPRKAGRLSRGSVEPADLPHDGESMHSASHRLGGGSRSGGRAHQSQSQNQNHGAHHHRGYHHSILTVHVREIPAGASEADVHAHFYTCGVVRECRMLPDPRPGHSNGGTQTAFVAFGDENAVREALTMDGSLLRGEPVRVMPSRTEVVPVDPGLLPRTEEEKERTARTVYVSCVCPSIRSPNLRAFLESAVNGAVVALHLQKKNKGNAHAGGRGGKPAGSVAFVEFETVESAVAAIGVTGTVLGELALRVAPSKTPLKEPKKKQRQRSHHSAEVSSTVSGATTGMETTESGETEIVHDDVELEDQALAEDGADDDSDSDEGNSSDDLDIVLDDANGDSSETTTASGSPSGVVNDIEATRDTMGKLKVSAEIPLVDETEFPPLGKS